MLARFNARYGATDPRAVIAIWSAWYFTATLPALLALNLFADAEPELKLQALRFVVAEDQRVEALKVPPSLRDLSTLTGPARFEALIGCHLAPFVELVVARGRVSRRVVWSNAGSTFDAFLTKISPRAETLASYRDARHLLTLRVNAGALNPLWEPVRIVSGRRVRRVCCMRFMVPDGRLCGTCPVPPARTADIRTGKAQA